MPQETFGSCAAKCGRTHAWAHTSRAVYSYRTDLQTACTRRTGQADMGPDYFYGRFGVHPCNPASIQMYCPHPCPHSSVYIRPADLRRPGNWRGSGSRMLRCAALPLSRAISPPALRPRPSASLHRPRTVHARAAQGSRRALTRLSVGSLASGSSRPVSTRVDRGSPWCASTCTV
jgi:hypothetical protein